MDFMVELILIWVHCHPTIDWALGIKGYELFNWKRLDIFVVGKHHTDGVFYLVTLMLRTMLIYLTWIGSDQIAYYNPTCIV